MAPWKWHHLLLAAALAVVLATTLSLRGLAFAQTQPQLVSAYLASGLPTADPTAAAWGRANPVEVPLTAQNIVLPMLGTGSIPTIQVRSLNDGAWIAFRLEWADATKNDKAIAQDQFRDAAAIQLPLNQTVPGVCMGVRGQPVNLWHWKADWQNDIDNGFQDLFAAYPNFWKDYYPFAVGTPPFKAPVDFAGPDARRFLVGWAVGNPLSDPARVTPVEELVAEGFGSATHRVQQTVLGRGVWAAGKWSVVFARPLRTSEQTQAQLAPGGKGIIAVAAWDGANMEVGARKQVSADLALTIAGPTGAPQAAAEAPAQGANYWWLAIPVGLAALVIGSGLAGMLMTIYYRSRPRP